MLLSKSLQTFFCYVSSRFLAFNGTKTKRKELISNEFTMV